MTVLEWLVIQTPKSPKLPLIFLGTVWDTTRDGALTQARQAWPARTLRVLCELQWRGMSVKERVQLLAPSEPADPRQGRQAPAGIQQVDHNTRSVRCVACNKPIYYHRDATGKWRRPPRFHAGHCRHIHQHTNHIPRPS